MLLRIGYCPVEDEWYEAADTSQDLPFPAHPDFHKGFVSTGEHVTPATQIAARARRRAAVADTAGRNGKRPTQAA